MKFFSGLPSADVTEAEETELMKRLAEKIQEEKDKVSNEDKELLFKKYPLLNDFSDKSCGMFIATGSWYTI